MKDPIRIYFAGAAYCALLASLNWFRTVEYSRAVGLKYESHTGAEAALTIAAAVVAYQSWRCLKYARARLESGNRVEPGRWIFSWGVLLFTLPLLYRRTTTSSWKEADGALATATGGYGHTLSGTVFVLAVLGMLLWQIAGRLAPRKAMPTSERSASPDHEAGRRLDEPVPTASG
ncbi:MAG: hypothetical protein HY302_05350 [Opitutae bacterium]|nr:hypothetical protein [Opitutae bacterium]